MTEWAQAQPWLRATDWQKKFKAEAVDSSLSVNLPAGHLRVNAGFRAAGQAATLAGAVELDSNFLACCSSASRASE